MNMELTDENIQELKQIPHCIVEESIYYDVMDIEVNILRDYRYNLSIEFRIEFLMCVVCNDNIDDFTRVPIGYTRRVDVGDWFTGAARSHTIENEAWALDVDLARHIRIKLSEIRESSSPEPTRVTQITFMRDPTRRTG